MQFTHGRMPEKVEFQILITFLEVLLRKFTILCFFLSNQKMLYIMAKFRTINCLPFLLEKPSLCIHDCNNFNVYLC